MTGESRTWISVQRMYGESLTLLDEEFATVSHAASFIDNRRLLEDKNHYRIVRVTRTVEIEVLEQ